jgi:hypothetical protein
VDEDQLDTGSGYEAPYGDALLVHQVHGAGRRGVQRPLGMGIERGQRYGEVRWKVMQDAEQHPAVDSHKACCGSTAGLVGEHGDDRLHLLSAQLQFDEFLLSQQHVCVLVQVARGRSVAR